MPRDVGIDDRDAEPDLAVLRPDQHEPQDADRSQCAELGTQVGSQILGQHVAPPSRGTELPFRPGEPRVHPCEQVGRFDQRDHAAVLHHGDRPALLGNHHGQRIGPFGNPDRGAVARAVDVWQRAGFRQRQHAAGTADAPGLEAHGAVVQGTGRRHEIVEQRSADFGVDRDPLPAQERFDRVLPLEDDDGAPMLFRQIETRSRNVRQECRGFRWGRRAPAQNVREGRRGVDLHEDLTDFRLKHDDDENERRGPDAAQHPGGEKQAGLARNEVAHPQHDQARSDARGARAAKTHVGVIDDERHQGDVHPIPPPEFPAQAPAVR